MHLKLWPFMTVSGILQNKNILVANCITTVGYDSFVYIASRVKKEKKCWICSTRFILAIGTEWKHHIILKSTCSISSKQKSLNIIVYNH